MVSASLKWSVRYVGALDGRTSIYVLFGRIVAWLYFDIKKPRPVAEYKCLKKWCSRSFSVSQPIRRVLICMREMQHLSSDESIRSLRTLSRCRSASLVRPFDGLSEAVSQPTITECAVDLLPSHLLPSRVGPVLEGYLKHQVFKRC